MTENKTVNSVLHTVASNKLQAEVEDELKKPDPEKETGRASITKASQNNNKDRRES